MRKIIIVIFILTLVNKTYSQYISFGFSQGFGVSKFYQNKVIATSHFDAFARSVSKFMIEFRPSYSNMSIHTELAYENKGSHNSKFGSTNLSYWTLPLLLRLHLGWELHINLVGGMYYSLLDKNNSPKEINSFDFGLCFGGGLGYTISKKYEIFVDYQNRFGLYSIYDETFVDSQGYPYSIETKNHYYSFNAGIYYHIINSKKTKEPIKE